MSWDVQQSKATGSPLAGFKRGEKKTRYWKKGTIWAEREVTVLVCVAAGGLENYSWAERSALRVPKYEKRAKEAGGWGSKYTEVRTLGDLPGESRPRAHRRRCRL